MVHQEKEPMVSRGLQGAMFDFLKIAKESLAKEYPDKTKSELRKMALEQWKTHPIRTFAASKLNIVELKRRRMSESIPRVAPGLDDESRGSS